jgi:ATP-dependent RNA helicase DeaD
VDSEEYIQRLFNGISIVKNDNYLKISDKIEHRVIDSDDFTVEEKMQAIIQLIDQSPEEHFIVFCSRNEHVDAITKYLNQNNITALPFSSDNSDQDKVENLFKFRSKNYVAFVCSDSANRGIHFDFDSHVIQFDSAKNAINLLHRFGRTGRLGKKGVVTSFVKKEDYALLGRFQELMDNSQPMKEIFSKNRAFSKRKMRE